MHEAYIALGSNLGNSRALITHAIESMSLWPEVKVKKLSSLYLTAPIGLQGPDFFNAVVCVHTEVDAFTLLLRMLNLEYLLGRSDKCRSGSRLIDLDLLLFNNHIMYSKLLVLPHPRLHERAFVLEPLLEIDEHIVIPRLGRAKDLLANLNGQRVERFMAPIALENV